LHQTTGLLLGIYANEHDDRYPFHTNGSGDAILLLLKENSPEYARLFTAPGDDGRLLKECLRTELLVTEGIGRAAAEKLYEPIGP